MKYAGTEGVPCVGGHHGASAVLMTTKVMTAFNAENMEAGLSERCNEFRASDSWAPTHAAMVTR